MDKGFLEGQVAVVRDQTKWGDFIVRTQDGDYHVDFDDGYYHQCMAKKLDGKTVRLGYYSIETNPDGTKWVQAGDDNTLEEIEINETLEEDEPPRRILKRPSRTINNVVKEVKKEEKKEVTAVKKMEDQKQEKSQIRKVFFKIIVPNYNNYLYIKKCLDSIKEQTFKDYVCIVVDDLSTDNSFKIAQIYAKRDPEHFIILQLEKKGYAGAARNKGLDYPVDSQYTYIIDSDDWLYNKNVFNNIHETIIKNKYPDVVRCSFQNLGGMFHDGANSNIVIEKNDLSHILRNGLAPWKSCWKSGFKCRFVENRAKNNDTVWGIRLFDQVNKNRIVVEKRPCYVYNRMSVTSCQNNIYKHLDKNCQDAERMLISDLENEKIHTEEIRKFRDDCVRSRKNWYKPEISVEDFFKNSYMITIDEKKFSTEMKIFQNFFGNFKPIKTNGNVDKKLTGPQNCLKSHIHIIEYAKKKNLPFVVVFEDDAYPRNNCLELLKSYLRIIPKSADMIILGWSNHSKCKEQKFILPYNKLTTILCGSHSYILFNSGYDKYLKYANQKNRLITADGYIYNNVGTAVVLDKPLFIQYSGSISMNKHIGYIFYGDHKEPPSGFPRIEELHMK